MGYSTNGLTFNTLRDANIHRIEETPKFSRCINWTSSQWLQALIGEVGELANEMKKLDRGDFDDMEVGDIREILGRELADIQTYLDLLAAKLGVDLGEATMAKWNEVSACVGSDIYLADDDWHRRSK